MEILQLSLFLPQKTETNKRQFKPLPMATYKSSKVAFEQQIPSTQDELKPLPTFGIAPTVEAKVCFLISLVMNLITIPILTLFLFCTRIFSKD